MQGCRVQARLLCSTKKEKVVHVYALYINEDIMLNHCPFNYDIYIYIYSSVIYSIEEDMQKHFFSVASKSCIRSPCLSQKTTILETVGIHGLKLLGNTCQEKLHMMMTMTGWRKYPPNGYAKM